MMWFDVVKVNVKGLEENFLHYYNTSTPEAKEKMKEAYRVAATPEEREKLKEEWLEESREKLKPAREKAEQWVIDTANRLDYVTINGDWVEIEPEWAKEEYMKYVFNMKHIHREVKVIKVTAEPGFNITENDMCLSEDKSSNTPIADSYVTVMLMAGNKKDWYNIWR